MGRTRYYYDRVGNLTKRVDPLSRETTYTYDAAGNVVTQTDPLGRVTAMSYDAVGNVAAVVKPSGTATVDDPTDGTVSYAYDAANRLVATTFSDDTAGFAYAYSPAGRVLSAERVQNGGVSSSSAYEYDAAGRTTSVVRTGPGGGTANYAYTGAGRLSGVGWSTGMAVAYSYNSVGQLTTVSPSGVGGVPMVQYGYDPAGLVSTVTRGGMGFPLTTAVTYDGAGQVASLVHASGATVLEGFDITRNLLGSPTEVTTTTGGSVTSALYSYDVTGRLRTECYPASGEVCTSKSPRMVYTYDKVGNRLTDSVRTVTGTKATTVVTDYAYDVADQLLTQSVGGAPTVTNTWTLNGALASSTTPDGTQIYTTDLTDELISLELTDGSTVGYTHDVKGNRTSRTVDGVLDVSWVWDELSSLPVRVGEVDASGTLTTAWLPDPASGTGSPLAQTIGGASSWLISDPFLNTVASVSTTGTTLSGTRDLNAFGVPITPATGSLADAATGFAGQYLDDATGLYDMRARDYDPSSGRFTATDPVAVPTGSPYFSTYTYGYNNPLMFADPSGLTACGPIGSDCNGANLVPEFRRLERANNDTGYLNLYHSLTEEQISEIPFDDMSYIHNEAVNRQMHQIACEDNPGACWAPCPEDDYQRCQAERGALGFVAYYAAPMALGMGTSAVLGRACAADAGAAAAARTTSVTGTSATNRAAFEAYKDLLRAQMARPSVTDKGLSRLLDQLYRPGATVGSGSTAAAVRAELANPGLRVGGRSHIQKAQDSILALKDWLRRNPTAPSGDRAAAENVIRDMENALGGH